MLFAASPTRPTVETVIAADSGLYEIVSVELLRDDTEVHLQAGPRVIVRTPDEHLARMALVPEIRWWDTRVRSRAGK